ncbi:hypothetical protein [Shouchella lonarensis]|uniref:Uncharacterized protein n=1 Tax=Shouchella lonarensis TaxID=1464122 RepID=A0A1G6HFD4_9BACI|nr:hypothetical protein [Shouchella lonarensis]SDB92864.1 hypothetical protein SAMN05421737_103265 [Shouchella lonarensis]
MKFKRIFTGILASSMLLTTGFTFATPTYAATKGITQETNEHDKDNTVVSHVLTEDYILKASGTGWGDYAEFTATQSAIRIQASTSLIPDGPEYTTAWFLMELHEEANWWLEYTGQILVENGGTYDYTWLVTPGKTYKLVAASLTHDEPFESGSSTDISGTINIDYVKKADPNNPKNE